MKAWAIVCSGISLAFALPGDVDKRVPQSDPAVSADRRPSQFDPASYKSGDIIKRDVAVIGAGASGTYGAIALKDLGKTVVVIEKHAVFGGHVNTYSDPATGRAVDYGVLAYYNTTVATDFFARCNVAVGGFGDAGFGMQIQNLFTDFRTGERVYLTQSTNYDGISAQINKYPNPEYGWNLPKPVPDDLLLPFRDFVEKYSLEDVAYTIARTATGHGNILDELTVYVFQRFTNIAVAELTIGNGLLVKSGNNSELFSKARAELGSSALVESTVIDANRPTKKGDVRLVVKTPTGSKLIMASQILVSIPLTLDNMSPFSLDSRESGLFRQFKTTAYYAALLKNTGFPPGFSYENAGINTTYNVPPVPAAYNVGPASVPGYYYVWYGAPSPLPEDQVKADIIATVKRLSHSNETAEVVAFNSHTPYKLEVPAAAIRNGFYDNLNGLQGYRNTWYTGALWDESGSSSLWNFTKQVVTRVNAAV